MDMLAYNPVEFNYLETLSKTFINFTRQNQFTQENFFNNILNRRIAIAMNTDITSMDPTLKIQSGINNLISDNP